MTVRQLLAQKGSRVETIRPEKTVFEALEKMASANIGALVVTDGGEIVGILSERDYARKVILAGRASRDTPVREIMSHPVVTIEPAASVEACMQMMTDEHVRHLPVVDDGAMVGIISIGDVVKTLISEKDYMIEQLQSYIDYR